MDFPFVIWPVSVAAGPPAPDHSVEMACVVRQLRASASPAQAAPLTQRLWEIWPDAPDQKAQELLNAGMQRREAQGFLGARAALDALVDYCPTTPKATISTLS